MGFSTTIIVLSPLTWRSHEAPRSQPITKPVAITLWQPVSIIGFGHTASPMAACFAQAFFRPMHDALRDRRSDILAPRIVPLSEKETLANPWLHGAAERGEIVSGDSLVEPAADESIFLPSDTDDILAHNAHVSCGAEPNWENVGAGLHPIVHGPPFLWFPCGEIADWLERAETEDSAEFKKLRDEKPNFLAVYRGHRAFLREMSAASARGMFVFESSRLPIHTN